MKQHLKSLITNPRTYLGIASLQAIVAVAGSLYFSEIANFAPCMLCWWQRIFIFPLALMLPIAFFTKDRSIVKYAAPLLAIGTAISLYHNEIYYLSIYRPEAVTSCSLTGPSCTALYINWLGFITIPFLALMSLFVMIICLVAYHQLGKKSAN